MPARRSARLKAKADEPASSEKQTQEPKKIPKRKAPVSNHDKPIKKAPKTKSLDEKSDDKSPGRQSKPKARAGMRKASNSSVQTSANTSNSPFSSLPPEVFNLVIEKIEDTKSLGNLSKTSKAFHSLVTPQLFKRVEGSVSFHAHIAKLIRTIEPLLTIKQRKQLKKEGQYKGQQESFPNNSDDNERPEIADCVRQALFDIGDPGKKHRYIVFRYIEELLEITDNLEVFAATDLTEPMATKLAVKKNLQALWLHTSWKNNSAAEALAATKGLKHLHLFTSNWFGTAGPPLELIWNSRSTLRSLDLDRSYFDSLYNEVVDKSNDKTESSNLQHDLIALRSFSIKSATINTDEVDSLSRAIDFSALENLKFGYKNVKIGLLFRRLIEIFSAVTSTDIKLRSLSLNLGSQASSNLTRMAANPEEEDPGIDFISSFNTLTSLTVVDAGIHSLDLPNPGLKDTLLQGLFMHTNLTTLEFRDSISIPGWKMPCLDTQMVKRFIENFPQLKHFHFYPERKQLSEIAEALSRGRNLESIGINTRGSTTKDEEEGPEFLRQLVLPILNRDSDDNKGDYQWGEYSKFNRLTMGVSVWEVGSKLGKAKKGIKKAQKITSASNSKRTVMYRAITRPVYMWLRGDLNEMEEWVNKIAKDLD
ncbi:hypothetical protein FVEN_g4504 [Fusarium venenatum]|uniref:F-box domain-containing protein n=1 Tax=Fusarium venenatum TaxID=56646 RepID=A0A2L2TR59_9HYPO|nr:uncharacterized protein FVRRES_02598 [Fusarium venenatum]KAG8357992.1 hypothetical protein FVEN_g4504 [Fusarium venenatum]CEI66086.1 unnamed protein product [Fusarium venenatum]